MQRFLIALCAAALLATGNAWAQSASSAAQPSCAPGDPVVWVNTHSGVYHMQGDRYFGKTKSGTYLCKSAADAKQYHAASAHGMKGPNSTSGATATPAMGATPTAMASPSGKHRRHRNAAGTMPQATTAPAVAVPTATATSSGSHRRQHRGMTPGASPSGTPAPAAT